jgi:hypothetical protein
MVRRYQDSRRTTGPRHFFDGRHIRDYIEARTAELGWDVQAEQPHFAQLGVQTVLEPGVVVAPFGPWRDLAVAEGPQRLLELKLIVVETEIHANTQWRMANG